MMLLCFAIWILLRLSPLASAALELKHSSPYQSSFFYKGHDLSSLKILEDAGTIYKDAARGNQTRPVEDILGNGGMNSVRLRLWVNPQDFQHQSSAYDLSYTIKLASRFHSKGYRIYLDFHFSDTWADPQKQYIPKSWPRTLQPLASTLKYYVSSTLKSFHSAGIPISIVSLGNEIRTGMLWPVGAVDSQKPASNFTGLATLLKAAKQGVNEAVAAGLRKPDVMIHIDNGWDLSLQTRWFSAFLDTGIVSMADWDMFGFSFYPFYSPKATFSNLEKSLHAMALKYSKPVVVAETDYPVQCDGKYKPRPTFSEPKVPISVEGQIEWNKRILEIIKKVPNNLGRGLFYWEPAWTNNTSLGSACEDAILFNPDWSSWPKTIAYSRRSVDIFK